MSPLHSIILGIVEGLTEFLPISSTAHISLTSSLLGIVQTDFVKSFEIAIQSGAMLAVIAIYWRKFLDKEIFKKITIAFIPTAIIGFILYKLIKSYLIGNTIVTLSSLFIGGIILIVFEKFIKNKDQQSELDIYNLSYTKTALIGLFQSIAVIPGVSRSGATIVSGRLLGLKKESIVEFSFLLAVPTILAASVYDLLKNYSLFSSDNLGSLSLGFIFSFITAIISIKFFISYINRHSLTSFGIYRILIAIIIFISIL
jgi:undecaprenyl-diphosphatase